MQEAASTKFNLPKTTTYIRLPIAFTGKDKRFEELSNACQFLLACIWTMNTACKGPAKLTYEYFVQKFGMSKETVSKSLNTLVERGFIEPLGGSRYRLLLKFNKKDYIIIDDYLHKQLWNVGGVQKRLARSRIKSLSFLHRQSENPETNGIFDSSQARIGVAIGLPKSTAGDSVRELALAGLISLRKADEHVKEACKRGLTRYTVDPELLKVKRCKPAPPPDELEEVKKLVKELGKKPGKKAEKEAALVAQWQAETEKQAQEDVRERKIKALHEQFLQDIAYRALARRISAHREKVSEAVKRRDIEGLDKLEPEAKKLKEELKAYLNAHGVPLDTFPVGAFYILN